MAMAFGPDESQADVIGRGPGERVLVTAGPGSGKTFTLVRRVARLLGKEGLDPSEVLVMSFTRSAVGVVSERVASGVGRRPEEVAGMATTFDSWATALLRADGGETPGSLGEMDYAERIEAATRLVGTGPDTLSRIRHLVVDEVQDLVGARAEFVLAVIGALPDGCGVTLLGDPCQALYDYQARAGELDSDGFRAAVLASGFGEAELAGEYRSLGGRPEWYSRALRRMRRAILSGDRPGCGVATSAALEEMRARSATTIDGMLDGCFGGGGVPGGAGVLARTNEETKRMGAFLDQRNVMESPAGGTLPVATVTRDPGAGPGRALSARRAAREDDAQRLAEESGVTAITVHASKGREYGTVYIAPETAEGFSDAVFLAGPSLLAEARAAYVALTRSRGETLVLERPEP